MAIINCSHRQFLARFVKWYDGILTRYIRGFDSLIGHLCLLARLDDWHTVLTCCWVGSIPPGGTFNFGMFVQWLRTVIL